MLDRNIKEVIIFFAITIFLSYFVFWGPIALFKIPTVNLVNGKMGPLWAIILFVIGGFIPSIIGITLTGIFEGKIEVKKMLKKAFMIKPGKKWFIIIMLTSILIAFSLISIYMLLGGKFDFSQFWIQLPGFIPLILIGPLSEEFGWRGFAIKRLMKKLNPNLTSLVIGVLWSFWHLPLFYIHGSSQYEFNLPFPAFLISVTGISFAFTYFYLKTDKSIFSAIFFHWIYTYLIQVVNSTITRTDLYNWLEFIPAFIVGLIFAILLKIESQPRKFHNGK